MPIDNTPPSQRRRPFRILLRFLDPRDTLNLASQLAIGTLLVALVDLRFLPLAAQQVSATAQGSAPPTTTSWLLLAIPIIVTVGWLLLANLTLRHIFAPSQPLHRGAPPTDHPTDSDGQRSSPRA